MLRQSILTHPWLLDVYIFGASGLLNIAPNLIASASYLDSSAFKSWPSEWLLWLRLFLGSLCPFSQCQDGASNLAMTASLHVLSILHRWIKKSLEFSFIEISMPPGVRCHRGVLCIIFGARWNKFCHLSVLQSAMEQKHVSTSCSASVWTGGNHNVFCKLGISLNMGTTKVQERLEDECSGKSPVSRNDKCLTEVWTIMYSDQCVMIEQTADKTRISCGLVRGIPKEDTTVLAQW